MSFFAKMNAKLDDGYKMTNINCDQCKFSLLINPKTKLLYCPKCDYETKEPAQLIIEKEDNDDLSEKSDSKIDQDIFNEDLKNMFSKPSKSDDQSKKLSQKLLAGWAMLEEVCPDCFIPIMRSKQGEKLCVGCDNAYQRQQKGNNNIIQKQQIIKEPTQNLASQTQKPQNIQQNIAQVVTKQLISSHGSSDIKGKLLNSLEKMLDFFDSKLDQAFQENDVLKVGIIQNKIFEILDNYKKLNQ